MRTIYDYNDFLDEPLILIMAFLIGAVGASVFLYMNASLGNLKSDELMKIGKINKPSSNSGPIWARFCTGLGPP